MSSRAEIQKLCLESLKPIKIGLEEDELQNGKDFYKYFFTNYPDLRVYFKGAQEFTADDVQKSERFEKQGQRILLAMHLTANIYDSKMVFDSFVREQVNRHRQFKMEPALWKAFWTVWTGYLDSKMELKEAQREAWMELGEEFSAVANDQLKRGGLPYVEQ